VTPRLGLSARPAGGEAYVPITPPLPQPLPFAADLAPLRQGLREEVVSGTGTLLDRLPIPAAGKTGTAQDSSAPDGGPDAWYTAYSPADAPQVVVTMNVRGGGQGYNTAEPFVRDLLEYFDSHATQILSTAPAQPPVPPAVAAIAAAARAPVKTHPVTAHPVTAAVTVTPLLPIGLRRRQLRQAERGSTRRPQPRTSTAAPSAELRIRTRLRGAARIPAAATRRRRRGPPPA
jgi:hypothetical protein